MIDGWDFGPVLSIAVVDALELWIGTEHSGVLRYDLNSGRLHPVDLPGNTTPVIVDMLTDPEGNLWLLDQYAGLYRTNRQIETYHPDIEGIQALLFAGDGTLYAGHPDGLYLLYPPDRYTESRKILEDINVVSLYKDAFGNVWAGTFGQGLYCRPAGGLHWLRYTRDHGLTDESILSIAGRDNELWLATLGGVTHIFLDRGVPRPYHLRTTNYNLADGLGTNFIYTVMVDKHGRVWFGTDGNGLSLLENDIILNYRMADTVELHSVYTLADGPGTSIWVGTDRLGLLQFDHGTFTHIDLPPTIQGEEISSLVTDTHGNLLIAHTSGVDILTEDGTLVQYPHGTSAGEQLVPGLNAYVRDTQGSVWIASQRQLLKYNRLQSAIRTEPYNLLVSVSSYNTPVDFHTRSVFSYGENYLTFGFKGIWYTNPRDVLYRYMLEGLDYDWKETREESVTYQNIPPGRYQFVLQSSLTDRFSDSHSVSYAFTIQKPYYETTAFILSGVLLLSLLIYTAVRMREKHLERNAAIERQRIESQLQTLKAQINPHFLFNSFNTLASIIEDEPHTAVEYVEHLSDFYRSILQYREKNVITLEDEFVILRSYYFLLHKRYGKHLKLDLPVQYPKGYVVPLAIQILVENAIKHNIISERMPLTIRISCTMDGYIVTENNLQPKIGSGESTGFGLQSLVARYALLTRRPVTVERDSGVFRVSVPILTREESGVQRKLKLS